MKHEESESDTKVETDLSQPKIGDLIGKLILPKLDATLPIYRGTMRMIIPFYLDIGPLCLDGLVK